MTALPISVLDRTRPGGTACRVGTPSGPLRLVTEATRADQVVAALRDWHGELAASVSADRELDLDLASSVVVDLTSAHPSGIAQLYAGRPTLLTSLIREPSMQPLARRNTRDLLKRLAAMETQVGFAPLHLIVGVASWSEPVAEQRPAADGEPGAEVTEASAVAPKKSTRRAMRESRTVTAPILMRPIAIVAPDGPDSGYEFTLEGVSELHPDFAAALVAHGVEADVLAIVADVDERSSSAGGFRRVGFRPSDALAHLADVARQVLPNFAFDRRLAVGSFLHPQQPLVDDARKLTLESADNDVVAALAGVSEAIDELRADAAESNQRSSFDPDADRGIGDLDPSQSAVLDAVAAGRNVFVDAPLGTDATSTAAAVVADAAATGRTVLYLCGNRRASLSLTSYLTRFDLEDLVLDVSSGPDWRSRVAHCLLTSMNSDAIGYDVAQRGQRRAALVDVRTQLDTYLGNLHKKRAPWNISAYDALQALAYLSAQSPAPMTTARVPRNVTVALTGERRRALAEQLAQAAQLGAFTPERGSGAWRGAQLTTAVAATDALHRVTRLAKYTLPELCTAVAATAEATRLRPAQTIREFGAQLDLLEAIRDSAEVFRAGTFQTDLTEMVKATTPRRRHDDHSHELHSATRRRMRKRAEELLRPGRRVASLHEALVKLQTQQRSWAQACLPDARNIEPKVPANLHRTRNTFRVVRTAIVGLQRELTGTEVFARRDLLDVPLRELSDGLNSLIADAAMLDDLPQRQSLVNELQAAGLGELVTDLARRGAPESIVALELELLWWSSVFEEILADEPTLAQQTGAEIDALGRLFRRLDREWVGQLQAPIRVRLRDRAIAALERREAAQRLYADLIEGNFASVRDLRERHGAMVAALRPVIAVTAPLAPTVLGTQTPVSLLVIDGAGELDIAEVVGAVARAKQVVVIGDPRSASGTAVGELARVLPHLTLEARVSRRDPELTRLLARHGYADVLRPAPAPHEEPLLHFELASGVGVPDGASGVIASTPTEVSRAVELAAEHAKSRPDESLAIIALTAPHAVAIRAALDARLREDPALAAFFAPRRMEPVVVTDVGNLTGLSREAVILAVGFGRTVHGRLLHRFGTLAEPAGAANLMAALGATRKRLTVLSGFGPSDLQPDRMRAPGPRLLLDLLTLAERRAAQPVGDLSEPLMRPVKLTQVDRLLTDLGDRLSREGYRVRTNWGPIDGDKVPLAIGHPSLPDEMLVAVVTDDATFMREPSSRARYRQWTERLEALGWWVTPVWSAVAFLDPEGEAERVCRVVRQALEVRRAQLGVPTP